MTARWFNEWSEKRGEVVTPGDGFSSASDFEHHLSVALFDANTVPIPDKGEGVSPTLPKPGMIGSISRGEEDGYYYARSGHPDFTALEHVLWAMEAGGTRQPRHFSSLSFSSGMAAIYAVLQTLARESGERSGVVLHGRVMYAHTKELLSDPEKRNNSWLGPFVGVPVETGSSDLDNLEATIQRYQRAGVPILGLMYEPVANPTMDYTDTEAVAALAHRYDIPVIVDNTFLTPYLQEPLRMGADIVVHSMTKYLSGRGDLLGGCVTGPHEFMAALKSTRTITGGVLAPEIALKFVEERLQDLPERMKSHVRNVATIALGLGEIEEGVEVCYPSLVHGIRGGLAGGVVSFVFEGSDEQAAARSLRLSQYLCDHPSPVRQATSLGEAQTLVLPLAGQIGRYQDGTIVGYEKLVAGNVPAGLVRIAAGREDTKGNKNVVDYLTRAINSCL